MKAERQAKTQAGSVYHPPGKERVKHIIAIASGKGGVGKSTVTANLALALMAEGYRVGVLDADIYGPSQGKMLGVAEGVRPEVTKIEGQSYYVPVKAQGLQLMSMALLTDERTPMVWRGPMASGALQQMLLQTWWSDLDFLLVDMPPGTGDIQLTLSQRVSLSGSVVVTTPQDIALLDAKRAIEMFSKVNVPVLGVVENMAWHTCSECGHHEAIFGEGGGDILSDEYGVSLLGQLPLARSIREQADCGEPTVMAAPESEHTQVYLTIAENIVKQVENAELNTQMPTIQIEE